MEAPLLFETGPEANQAVTPSNVSLQMWLILDDGRLITVLSSRTSSVTEQVSRVNISVSIGETTEILKLALFCAFLACVSVSAFSSVLLLSFWLLFAAPALYNGLLSRHRNKTKSCKHVERWTIWSTTIAYSLNFSIWHYWSSVLQPVYEYLKANRAIGQKWNSITLLLSYNQYSQTCHLLFVHSIMSLGQDESSSSSFITFKVSFFLQCIQGPAK